MVFFDADMLVLAPLDELVESPETLWTLDAHLGGNCINGGLLVTTPNRTVFDGLVSTLRGGDFRSGSAWGGSGIGWCYGGQTFQGIIPYYFRSVLHRGDLRTLGAWEDNNNGVHGRQETPYHGPLAGVRSVHFTWCRKPWECGVALVGVVDTDFCHAIHARFWRHVDRLLSGRPDAPASSRLLRKLREDHARCHETGSAPASVIPDEGEI